MDSNLILTIFSKLYGSRAELSANKKKIIPNDNYFLIPGKNGFRWILPENPRFGMPVLKQWHPYDLSSKLKWEIILTAYQLGQLKNIPGVDRINVSTPPYRVKKNVWADSKDYKYSPVVYIGTPGPNQKAVVSVVEQTTLTVHCILKIPIGENASKKIIHEAKVIKALNEQKGNLCPDIFFIDEKRGMTGQSVISGKLTNRKMTNHHIQYLTSLSNKKITTLGKHCEQLFEKLYKMNDTNAVNVYNLMNKVMLEKDFAVELPSVWSHGDFAPWNLKLTNAGIQAIDWEDAKKDDLPLQDIFHFYYIQAYLFKNNTTSKKIEFSNTFVKIYCNSLGIPTTITPKLNLFYLVNAWANKKNEKNFDHAHFLLKKITQL